MVMIKEAGPRRRERSPGVTWVLWLMGHHERVRVLVVEDNEVVAGAVAEGLRDQGMAVDVAPEWSVTT